jgi:hypothetical protein
LSKAYLAGDVAEEGGLGGASSNALSGGEIGKLERSLQAKPNTFSIDWLSIEIM